MQTATTQIDSRYLDRREAAEYLAARGLRVAKNTLQKFATIGGGPAYRRFGGRVVYLSSDLDNWIAAKLSAPRHSSSDAKAKS